VLKIGLTLPQHLRIMNHRIGERLEGTLKVIQPQPLCHGQGPLPLGQGAHSPIQPGLEHFPEKLGTGQRMAFVKESARIGFFYSHFWYFFLRFSLTFPLFVFHCLLPREYFVVCYPLKKTIDFGANRHTAIGKGSCFISRCEGNFKKGFEAPPVAQKVCLCGSISAARLRSPSPRASLPGAKQRSPRRSGINEPVCVKTIAAGMTLSDS